MLNQCQGSLRELCPVGPNADKARDTMLVPKQVLKRSADHTLGDEVLRQPARRPAR